MYYIRTTAYSPVFGPEGKLVAEYAQHEWEMLRIRLRMLENTYGEIFGVFEE